ncbi:MAG: GTPase HflX [Bacteroidetes bacterium]|nr:GTPase HflX [Bacteroidota bacterium]MBU2584078.1 GTPase HflX [Bacteroidota bacterium]
MLEIKSNQLEKVVLVGAILPGASREIVHEHLDELHLLCTTAGAVIENVFVQDVGRPNAAFLIGKGKAEEISLYVQENKISAIIFDHELSAVQVRNMENLAKCKVLDRSAVILDIFASHAKSREAKTQVELAQYEYFLPRLTRQWTHLSKQYGGIGTKGPGETQIETDRRIIKTKILSLKQKLVEIDVQRDTQRKQRTDFFKVVLVGYTNVGKSTLLNFLSDANVLVEDKLFATLDSTTRTIKTKSGSTFLLSDTVGFIRKLPHNLIASFRSTLREIIDADLILHLVDSSHHNYQEQINVVDETLEEIEANKDKVQIVFNKIDVLDDVSQINKLSNLYPGSVFISAERGVNINQLYEKIGAIMNSNIMKGDVEINFSQSKILSSIHDLSESVKTKYFEDRIAVSFEATRANYMKIKKLISNSAM